MKRMVAIVVAVLALLVAQSVTASPAADVVARVNGGGIAVFTPPADPKHPITFFAVNAQVMSDGSAKGMFECGIPGLLSLNGDIETGVVNPDGTVTVTGHFDENDAGGAHYSDLPFSLTMRAGGPGTGGFSFTHPLGTDVELVASGRIFIR